jgi:hypothetical protein
MTKKIEFRFEKRSELSDDSYRFTGHTSSNIINRNDREKEKGKNLFNNFGNETETNSLQ